MSNNEPAPGGENAGDEVGGSGGGKSILGGAAQQSARVQASFVGAIFPAPLDENGALRDQSLREGFGRAHMIAVVFPYQRQPGDDAGPIDAARAQLDKKLGQPFFVAYLYPNPFLDNDAEEGSDEPLFIVGGSGGGKAILGGVTQAPTYMGQFRAVLPEVVSGDQEGSEVSPPPGE